MTPIAILMAGRRVGLRQALLSKGVAFVSSCGIVAAQLTLVTFEAPAPPPAPAPPDIVVSLVPVDLVRPKPAPRPIVRQVAEPGKKPTKTQTSKAAAAPSPTGTLIAAAPVTPAAAPVQGPSPAPSSAAPAPIQTAAVAELQRADDALQRYQDLVWRMIMARRPPTAHLRGGAQIAFHLMPSGAPCDIRIARTSGDPMLDRLAIATVQRAGPFPKPPAGLRPDTELEIWFQFK